MRDRLAGKASAALTEQRQKIEDQLRDALLNRKRSSADSSRGAKQSREDSLRHLAEDVLRGFFGKRDTAKTKPKPAPAPPPPPRDTTAAPADTTPR